MKEHQNEAWRRIEAVIKASKARSINAFAHQIGLPNAEALYRIRKGKNGISKAIAARMCDCFPQFEVSWLICDSKCAPEYHWLNSDNRLTLLPLFQEFSTWKTSHYLYLPEAMTRGAEIALFLKNDLFYPTLCKGLVALFRRSEGELAYGDVHLIYTAHKTILCTIKHNCNSEKITYSPLDQDGVEEIRINRNTIQKIYVNCGVYIV